MPQVAMTAGEGWSVEPARIEGDTGVFVLRGVPDRLRNEFTLQGSAGPEKRQAAGFIEIGTRIFAGDIFLKIWLGGQPLYEGLINKEPGHTKAVEAKLRKGWNPLVFKANHRAWLWQFSLALEGVDGDALADLRYSSVPALPTSTAQRRF